MKYAVSDFREVFEKISSGLSERSACNEVKTDDKYFHKCYRKWAKAGRPADWPLPTKRIAKKSRMLPRKQIDEFVASFDKNESQKKINKLVYQSIINSLSRDDVRAQDIKVAIEFLQLVHPDYQEKANENNVQMYIDGWRKLMAESNV